MNSESKICFFYKGARTKNTTVNDHSHHCYEIVYYLRGFGHTMIGGKRYSFSDHCFSVIKPDTVHDEHHLADGELIFIGFEHANTGIELKQRLYSSSENHAILPILNGILQEAAKQKDHYEIMLDSKINELIVLLSRINQYQNQKCKDLKYIVNYMDENYSQKVNFRELACLCGYSYDHFRHIFKKETGFSPQNYLIEQRLIKAKELLTHSYSNITEIAYTTGFSNNAQFSAMFKERFGQPPKAFQSGQRRQT